MPSGKVKWFSSDKGYGFIAPDDGVDDIFVHVTAVQDAGLDLLRPGNAISYEIGSNSKTQRTKAINLRLL